MATTTNFGWTTPDDTALVKDGASAIRTLGSSIDTSMGQLKGGTTGQILSKTSNTDMAFTWINNDQGDITGITTGATSGLTGGVTSGTADLKFNTTAKGGLLIGTGSGTVSELAVGSNTQVLTADSTTATGLKWATPASGVTFVGCSLFNSTNTSIGNNNYTTLTYDSELYDTDGFHSTTTNTSRITIPSGKAGYYRIETQNQFDSTNTTGTRSAGIILNGTGIGAFYSAPSPTDAQTVYYTQIRYLAVGDYVEGQVYQKSGGNLTILREATNSYFRVTYLGA